MTGTRTVLMLAIVATVLVALLVFFNSFLAIRIHDCLDAADSLDDFRRCMHT